MTQTSRSLKRRRPSSHPPHKDHSVTRFKPPVNAAVLEEITRKVVNGFQPERIILFGSYAYGTPTRDSDVDLLVIVNSRERPMERSARIVQVCRPRYVALDVLVRTSEEIAERLEGFDPFLEEVLSRGKVLYEAPR